MYMRIIVSVAFAVEMRWVRKEGQGQCCGKREVAMFCLVDDDAEFLIG